MIISNPFRDQLSRVAFLNDAIDLLTAGVTGIGGVFSVEHNEDGTHSAITATSADLTGSISWGGGDALASSTEVVLTSGSYPDPSWITSLAYTKVASVPTATVLGRTTAGTGAAEALTTLPAVNGSALTNLTAANLTGTIASAVQDNITRTGTLVSGATGAGFTLALATSTISGDLPDANLSANVPLLNAANTFTGGLQTATRSTDGTALSAINTFATLTGEVVTVNTTRAAASAFNLLNLYANSVSQFSVGGSGVVAAAGTLAWGGGSAITSSNSVALLAGAAFTGAVSTTSTLALAATQKFYLDGVAASGDTYLHESAANTLGLVVGGTTTLALTATTAALVGAVTAARSTDGTALAVSNSFATLTGEVVTVNTTRAAASAFTLLNLYANSVSQFSVGGAGAVSATGTLAWGGGSAITSSNSVALLAGAAFTGAVSTTSSLALAATQKLYLDGVGASGDTYLHESAANTLGLVAGGTTTLALTATTAALVGAVTAARSSDGTTLAVSNSHATLTGEVVTVNTTRAAATAFNLLNLYANSVSQFSVGGAGAVSATGTVAWGGGSAITSSNSVALLAGAAFTGDITVNDSATYSLKGTGSNGTGIAATHASGALRFYSGGTTLRWTLDASGHVVPNGDATYDIGSTANTIRKLHLANTGASPSASAPHSPGTTRIGTNDNWLGTPDTWIAVYTNSATHYIPCYA